MWIFLRRTTPVFLGVVFTIAAQQPRSGTGTPALYGGGARPTGSSTVQSQVAGGSNNTIQSAIQVQGVYSGSVLSAQPTAEPLRLSLEDAVQRGIQFNLGSVSLGNGVRLARGQERAARGVLLPNLEGTANSTIQQLSFATFGVTLPGVPSVVGPFQYFFAGASVSQAVADFAAWNNYRAARTRVEAANLSAQDGRDTVALAVAGSYLECIAADARVRSAEAQITAAEAVYRQAVDRHDAGLNAQIDVTRTHVELQTQRLRLTSMTNGAAKMRIALARLIGLPAAQALLLTDYPGYTRLDGYTQERALAEAYENRRDWKAIAASLRAARYARKGASAERLPTVHVDANYGLVGINPANSNGTFAVTASVRVPIWDGGRIAAGVLQADAVVAQRQAEQDELGARIDAEIRVSFLDLSATYEQVTVAESSVALARDALRQSRDRFNAGVADSVEVVQAQEALSAAELDYIAGLFSNNLAKINLARAAGQTIEKTREFLRLP